MKRLTIFLLLLVTACAQVSVTLNGRVTGYYAEAVADYAIYNGRLIDGNAVFQWDILYRTVNIDTNRSNPTLTCTYRTITHETQRFKQTCDIRHYLVISYDNQSRYCAVTRAVWQRVGLSAFVKVDLSSTGNLECEA